MRAARCPHCGRASRVVRVHGHGQCSFCHTNVDPCCSGADAANEVHDEREDPPVVAQQQLRRVFGQLGGPSATVTREALRHGLASALRVPLDEAEQVLASGLRAQRLVVSGAGLRLARRTPKPPVR